MFIIERFDPDEKARAFYTENDEYGIREEAAEYDSREAAEEALENDPWKETGNYHYKIKKIN